MKQVVEFFQKLFDTADWPARWHCGNWADFHGWLYIISDLLIWSAYFAIPLIILKYISRRTDARFVRGYFLFAGFILACGSTHLMDAVTFWYPAYRLDALVRFVTGILSWATVFYTAYILPKAISLRSHSQMEKEIIERKRTEEELQRTNFLLNEAQDISKLGSWQWDVRDNKLIWSENLYRIYEIKKNGQDLSYNDFIGKVHPDDRLFVQEHIQEALNTKKFQTYRHRIVMDDGTIKVMQGRGEVIMDENGDVLKMIGTGQDITDHHQAQQELLNKTNELETANIELQKFAYVASHDLQEPLRKILTFASLLEKEAGDVLPDKSKGYLSKIVHSSSRMQQLIEDILNFSSLKQKEEVFEKVNLNTILQQVLSDMEVVIEKNRAVIKHDTLPEAEVIPTQIRQLFQNLLSNAVKFKSEDRAPRVDVKAKVFIGKELLSREDFVAYLKTLAVSHRLWEREKFLAITVKDNGIGFDPVYAEKIFEIFQRLHNHQKHQGTGIGLAICKRIIDNHHGFINAASKENEGATFQIILPISQKNFIN